MMNRRERMHREFHEDLEAAQTLSQRAMNALYAESGPKRGFWYRRKLGKAQTILMGLVVKEIKRKAKEDGKHST